MYKRRSTEENSAPPLAEISTSRLTRGAMLRRVGLGAGTALAAAAPASAPAMSIAQAAAAATRKGTMHAQKNVVLVHGGFVDGSGWEGVYDILKKDGYNVSVVQNPTVSLADDVAEAQRNV